MFPIFTISWDAGSYEKNMSLNLRNINDSFEDKVGIIFFLTEKIFF